MEALKTILTVMPWYAWIAIVAIIGGTIGKLLKLSHQHRERMEMIRQGMDPGESPKD